LEFKKGTILQNIRFKKPAFISSIGVGLMLFGIFILFLLALHQYFTCELPFGCALNKRDFAQINLQNIFIITACGVIFTGILTELAGVFLLSKTAQDTRIFYNKLNSYFAASLFFAISLKDVMASSDYFFLIKTDVSRILVDSHGATFVMMIYVWASFAALICFLYFLGRNSIYLHKVFGDITLKKLFLRWAFYIVLTAFILFLHIYILKSFSIVVFMPYLLSLLGSYHKISKANKAEEVVVSKKANRTVERAYYTAIIILVIALIIAVILIIAEYVRVIFYIMFIMLSISFVIVILPHLVLFVLQRFDLTKIVICAAALETAFFWIFFFSPFHAALFGR
jgi:hypothetical protein